MNKDFFSRSPKPHHDATGLGIYLAHLSHLLVPLNVRTLIDAYGVYPKIRSEMVTLPVARLSVLQASNNAEEVV
jgi:hypothetical protein